MNKTYPTIIAAIVAASSAFAAPGNPQPADMQSSHCKSTTNPVKGENAFVTEQMLLSSDIKRPTVPVEVDGDNQAVRRTPTRDDEPYNVQIDVVYPEGYYPSSVLVNGFEGDFKLSFPRDEQTWKIIPSIKAEIPAGTYDFAIPFTIYDTETWYNLGYGLLIKEDVTVPCDEPLVFDAADMVNHISFRVVLSDGSDASTHLIRRLDEEPWLEVIEPGSVHGIYAITVVGHKDYGRVLQAMTGCDWRDESGYDSQSVTDIYINDVSDKYYAWQLNRTKDDKDAYFNFLYCDKIEPETKVVNDPDTYTYYEEEFASTPNHDKYGCEKETSWAKVTILDNGAVFTGESDLEAPGVKPHAYIGGETDKFSSDELRYQVFLGSSDLGYTQTFDYGEGFTEDFYITGNIIGLPFSIVDGKKLYVNNNHSECGNYAFQAPAEGEIYDYPGHERFSFTEEEKGDNIFGNSAPILAFGHTTNPNYDDPSKLMIGLRPAYIGRMGEVRCADLWDLNVRILVDDYEIFESTEGDVSEPLNEWGYKWSCVKDQSGTYDYIFNNENIYVDGIRGYNRTHVTVGWGDDKNAPTLQMLMFRDANDRITDRFNRPEDGVIEFAGGDFNWFDDGTHYYYSCEPMEVKVEYAPYGTDDWAEIEVKEVPEYFFMPGFGYFYRGSLASVDKPSDNGWYDVRFTLTDAMGYTQEQVIGPAFRIEEVSAVSELEVAVGQTEYYNMQGVRVANPAQGIFVKRTGNRAEKVVIK